MFTPQHSAGLFLGIAEGSRRLNLKPQELYIYLQLTLRRTIKFWKASVHVGKVTEVLVCLACCEVSVFKVYAFLHLVQIDVLYSFTNPYTFCIWWLFLKILLNKNLCTYHNRTLNSSISDSLIYRPASWCSWLCVALLLRRHDSKKD